MWELSNNDLMSAYMKANELNLDLRFIQLLEKEMEKRLLKFLKQGYNKVCLLRI